ncbi:MULTISPECIES: glycosyltransferase family 1 protein [Spirulina sp. CCY15215]|uniref:glycosyltransferase family 4 protein n=1 Tax=Spirulina sp. CCY15215 TaxID=2767591 RepID=UPI001951F74C|nr:glycosyltransferase family 1 protein [Spirulina major]
MRILYDGSIYKMQVTGGVNRYFQNLIQRLPDCYTPILTTTGISHIGCPQHSNLKLKCYHRFGLHPGRISYFIEPYYFRWIEGKVHPDLWHPTYYNLLNQREISQISRPIVITVHDTIHEIFADRLDPEGIQAQIKDKAIAAADTILCVSENTHQDLLKYYPHAEGKVKVTYLASELHQSLVLGDRTLIEQPYFLYVGSRWFYKNVETLLKAFKKVISVYKDIKLCLVSSAFSEQEKRELTELNLTDYLILYDHIDDRTLAQLYHKSIALVYPSLYEGFGLPPLEAMSCGTVAIASNVSSIPEIVGDAALLFKPTSVDELADSMIFLLENPLERERLIEKGKQQVKLFSWEKTVNQTINTYQSLL